MKPIPRWMTFPKSWGHTCETTSDMTPGFKVGWRSTLSLIPGVSQFQSASCEPRPSYWHGNRRLRRLYWASPTHFFWAHRSDCSLIWSRSPPTNTLYPSIVTTYLAHQTSDGQAISLEVRYPSLHLCPEVAEEVGALVEDFNCYRNLSKLVLSTITSMGERLWAIGQYAVVNLFTTVSRALVLIPRPGPGVEPNVNHVSSAPN